MESEKSLLVSVVGPTAAGKTKVAIALAKKFNCEIISTDSRQLFKELEIGTAKPSDQELREASHHFINSHSIREEMNAGKYGREAKKVIARLHKKNRLVLAVGGSTLYLKSLWEGFDEMPQILDGVRSALNSLYQQKGITSLLQELEEKDPEYFNQVDKKNAQRLIRALEVIRSTGRTFSSYRRNSHEELPYENLKIGLEMDREVLFERINSRMDEMINDGLFQEAEALIDFRHHNALQTVGYSEIFEYLDGSYDRDEAIRLLKRNSRRYAKRQMTWFKRYDDIHWLKPAQMEEMTKLIESTLSEE